MRLGIASFALVALLAGGVLGAAAWAADTGSASGSSGSGTQAPAASNDGCKNASEGAQCKFQGRRGHEISGTCTNRNGALACVPAHHGMHRGGQGTPAPMQ